ncbi:MAG: A/G-specific adenine glycosylase [Bacteroidia bacterium]|nr:A/G-specific adenine glycosylase [Bacteroidia bacterium]
MQIVFKLFQWYALNKRVLPWREITDPYKIWLSEIIMQQTQVQQGLPYYNKFTDRFPTVNDLANAPEDEVLRLWQGLGYYSRARNLHAAAKQVISDYGGVFPADYNKLLALKGVGEYTAAAIASFAFGLPFPVVDGNVYRFISRLYGITEPINTNASRKIFTAILNDQIPPDTPDIFNSAIMEFGALHCKPQNPLCNSCPFNNECYAFRTNTVKEFPVKAAKKKVKVRYFNYFDFQFDGGFYLNKRPAGDIWQGLYEFPLLETAEPLPEYEAIKAFSDITGNEKGWKLQETKHFVHKLTHQTIYASFFKVNCAKKPDMTGFDHQLIQSEELDKYPVHRLLEKYLLLLQEEHD